MARVRCTCLTRIVPTAGGDLDLRLEVPDPACGYVVHRLAAELSGTSTRV